MQEDEQERREYEAKYSLAERKKFVEALWSLSEKDQKAIDEIITREEAKTVGALSSSELNDLVIKEVLRRAGTFPVTAQANPFEKWAELNQLEQRLILTSKIWDVKQMEEIRKDAMARSERMFTESQRNRGIGDAWRHLYWNARMTQVFDIHKARHWSWAHDCVDTNFTSHAECEREVEGGYYQTRGQERNFRYYSERNMDLWNNATGQWFGHYNKNVGADNTAMYLKYFAELGYYGESWIWKIEAQDGSRGQRVYILGDQLASPCNYATWNGVMVPSKRDVREFWCLVTSNYQRPWYVPTYN